MKEIAILLATYNGEKYLPELMNSIFNQTYKNFICYIHDDGSTDCTIDIVLKYKEKYSDQVILLDYPPTGGSKFNFMSMLRITEERYIMLADQDDHWMPNKIEISYKKIKELEKRGSNTPCLVFGDLQVVDSNLNTIAESFMHKMGFNPVRLKYQQLIAENIGAGCTMILNHALLEYAVKLKDVSHIRMHDGWLMVIGAVFGKIGYIEESTILYRQHPDNTFGIKKKGIVEKVRINIKLFLNGENKRLKLLWLKQMDDMAIELLQIEDLPKEVRPVLRKLTEIHKRNKISRIVFYVRNDFLRSNNNLWMLMWI